MFIIISPLSPRVTKNSIVFDSGAKGQLTCIFKHPVNPVKSWRRMGHRQLSQVHKSIFTAFNVCVSRSMSEFCKPFSKNFFPEGKCSKKCYKIIYAYYIRGWRFDEELNDSYGNAKSFKSSKSYCLQQLKKHYWSLV